MQPKKYTNPKIALLNVELELKAEKTNAEIRIDSVEVCATILGLKKTTGKWVCQNIYAG